MNKDLFFFSDEEINWLNSLAVSKKKISLDVWQKEKPAVPLHSNSKNPKSK